jgi:zinc protease
VVKAPAETPYLLMGFKAPRLERLDQDIDPFALEMLAAVLSGDDNARLPRQLVRGERLADQAFASYDMTGRGPALFMLGGAPAKGRSVTSRIYQRDSLMAQATELAGLEMIGLGWQAADRMLERIRAVQPAEVREVARRMFSEDSLTIVTLDPQPLDRKRPISSPTLRH